MKKSICGALFLLTSLITPASADSQAAADYIVSKTVTRTMFEAAISAQRPLIIGAIQNEFRAQNITLTDPDRFFDLFMSEFLDEFTASMRAQSASIYLDNFTEQQLEDIAAFFKTSSGQAYLDATPILMAQGAQMGRVAGGQAGINAGKRVAARIEEEGLVVVDDPSLLSRLLDALR